MGVRHMQGTSAYIETLRKNDDEERDRRKCVYYDSNRIFCTYSSRPCQGSAHCDYYDSYGRPVNYNPESIKREKIFFLICKGSKVSHVKYGDGIVKRIKKIVNAGVINRIVEVEFTKEYKGLKLHLNIPQSFENGDLKVKTAKRISTIQKRKNCVKNAYSQKRTKKCNCRNSSLLD